MKLENAFEVTAPPEEAWALLMDVPRVIPCMPGAELVETTGDDAWKARMRVKMGPISLAFLADIARDEADEAGRRVRLTAKAREERGRGNASASIESTLSSAGDKTRVETVTDLTLSGPVAQYGRGMVQDVSEQLLRSFAACLEQELSGPVAPEPAATDGDRPTPGGGAGPSIEPPAVSGFEVLGGVVRTRAGRLAEKVGPRELALGAGALLAALVTVGLRRRH